MFIIYKEVKYIMKFELDVLKFSADVVVTSGGCDPDLAALGIPQG